MWDKMSPAYSYYQTPYQQYRSQSESSVSGGCCSVRNGAGFVGLIEVVFVAATLGIYVAFFMDMTEPTAAVTAGLIVGVTASLSALLLVLVLFAGLCRRSSGLLLPHLVAQIVAICLMTAVGALILLASFVGVEVDESLGTMFPSVALAIGVLCLGMGMAEVWFFFVVREAYHEFRTAELRRLAAAAAIAKAREAYAQQSKAAAEAYASALEAYRARVTAAQPQITAPLTPEAERRDAQEPEEGSRSEDSIVLTSAQAPSVH